MKTIRIGNGCGFWGDNIDAPILLAEQGKLDYLTLEYLAELSMSILAIQKQRDPKAGFPGDVLSALKRLTPILTSQPGLKVVTNGGGMNALGCAEQARANLDAAGLVDRKIGVVQGDDLLPVLDELMAQGHPFQNMDTGLPLSTVRERVVSVNAYLGAAPIVAALAAGCSIVITGRVADASLTVAPAVHEFGWDWNDWDHLSAATVAGHLIECGAQVTGGLWCNWADAPNLGNIGYPIVEITADGTFEITKPDHTGGAVNRETVAEQLLYEVGDPAAYLTPDVVADFTQVSLEEIAADRVRVTTRTGKPATDSYKVSIAYRDGFAASGTLLIFGPNSVAKAKKSGAMLLERLARAGNAPEFSNIECLGGGDCVPGVIPATCDPPEVVLRVSVRDSRRAVVERFTKEIAALVTSGLPGTTGYTGGRPQVREVFAYWPALVSKTAVKPTWSVL
jgi:hypothetical protein